MVPITLAVATLITNVLMQATKKLSGLRSRDNNSPIYLAGFLAFFSLLSSLASAYFMGEPLDPNQISEWVGVTISAAFTYFAASGVYEKVLKKFL